MKFKEGQKVRVNKNLKNIKRFKNGYMEGMAELEGKIVTISKVYNDEDIVIKEDKNGYLWDKRAFSLLKVTKQELLDMPVGTKIYTDAEDKDYQKWTKTEYSFTTGNADYLGEEDINTDLTIDNSKTYFGTKIIKIEKPTYETIYDYSTEVQEMTVAEIEEALGHAVKIIKEDN